MKSLTVHEEVRAQLADIAQLYTSGRKALIETFLRSKKPLTIDELIERNKVLSSSSVYRNVSVLMDAGVVQKIVSADDFARYELSEGLTQHHHHHLVCSDCGDVFDYAPPAAIERSIRRLEKEVAERTGFQSRTHRIDLLGSCRSCSR